MSKKHAKQAAKKDQGHSMKPNAKSVASAKQNAKKEGVTTKQNNNKKDVPAKQNDKKKDVPAKQNDKKKDVPAKQNGKKKDMPAKRNDKKKDVPAKQNDKKKDMPAKRNDKKKDVLAKQNDKKKIEPQQDAKPTSESNQTEDPERTLCARYDVCELITKILQPHIAGLEKITASHIGTSLNHLLLFGHLAKGEKAKKMILQVHGVKVKVKKATNSKGTHDVFIHTNVKGLIRNALLQELSSIGLSGVSGRPKVLHFHFTTEKDCKKALTGKKVSVFGLELSLTRLAP